MAKPAAKRRPNSDAPFHAPNWPGPWKVEKLTSLTPYAHNARTHPPAQVTFLADLLKKFGPDQPIVVDEDGVILKGHGRRLAALEAGIKEFPVVRRTGMSDEDKRAMRIADNQSALMSGWDTELMQFEIESLKRAGYDVSLLGFGEAQLVQFTTTPGPPGSFPQFGEDIETEYCCPKCNFVWSGNPRPGRDKKADENDPMPVRVRQKVNPRGRSRKAAKVHKRTPLARSPSARKNKTQGNDDANSRRVDGPPSKG